MRKHIILAALCLMGMAAQAQQNLSWGQGPQVVSPDVHADNSVTFNLIAPEAQKVQITGGTSPTGSRTDISSFPSLHSQSPASHSPSPAVEPVRDPTARPRRAEWLIIVFSFPDFISFFLIDSFSETACKDRYYLRFFLLVL